MFDVTPFMRLFAHAKEAHIFDKAVLGFILPSGKTKILPFNTKEDSVFDIASLTKVCPTSTVALKFILEGKISLDDTVKSYIQEFNTTYAEDVLIRHLLTHSLDYRVPMKTLIALSPEKILDYLYNYKFNERPGTIFNYGNPASILLGIILQKVSGCSLQQLGESLLFKPLKMNRTGYNPTSFAALQDIIPTEICAWRKKTIQGEVHDESAFVLSKLFPVGSAGMFSCVPDLLHFVSMLLNDGTFENTRILPKGILNLISENAFKNQSIQATALGFELNAGKFMGKAHSARTFGKTGFTGASFVADAEKHAAVILLSNFTYPHREKNADRIHAFRRELSDTFFNMV